MSFWDKAKNAGSGLWNKAKGLGTTAWEKAKDAATAVGGGVKDAATTVKDEKNNIATSVKAEENLLPKSPQWSKGMGNALDWAKDKAAPIVDKAVKAPGKMAVNTAKGKGTLGYAVDWYKDYQDYKDGKLSKRDAVFKGIGQGVGRAGGQLGGAFVGSALGSGLGMLGGAAVGTLVEPGGGTVVGALGGAEMGDIPGGLIGAELGGYYGSGWGGDFGVWLSHKALEIGRQSDEETEKDSSGSTIPGSVPAPPPVHRADGGDVRGPGSSIGDKIPAYLSDGEFVMNARSTSVNRPFLQALNSDPFFLQKMLAERERQSSSNGPAFAQPAPSGQPATVNISASSSEDIVARLKVLSQQWELMHSH